MDKTKYVCEECGSDQIQQVMWVYVNTDKIVDMYGDGSVEDLWCEGCEEYTRHVTEEEFNQEQDDTDR